MSVARSGEAEGQAEEAARDGMRFGRIALSGTLWAFAQTIAERALQAAVFLTAARLLGPRDFGLAALALALPLVFVATVQGFAQVVVRQTSLTDRYLATAFAVVLLVGLGLTGLTMLVAPIESAGLHEPPLTAMIRLAALAPLVTAGGIVSEGLLIRRFAFRPLAIRRILGQIASAPLCIGLASAGWGAWSMIANTLLTALIAASVSVAAAGWRPRGPVGPQDLGSILHDASRLMASEMIMQANTRLGDVIVGLALGPGAAGIFRMARTLLDLVVGLAFTPLANVLLPIFARMAHDRRRSIDALHRVVTASSIVLNIPLVVTVSLADSLAARLPAAWTPLGGMLTALAFVLPTVAVLAPCQVFCVAGGRSGRGLAIGAVDFVLNSLSLWLGARSGLPGVAVAFTARASVSASIAVLLTLEPQAGPALRRFAGDVKSLWIALAAVMAAEAVFRLHPSARDALVPAIGVTALATGLYMTLAAALCGAGLGALVETAAPHRSGAGPSRHLRRRDKAR